MKTTTLVIVLIAISLGTAGGYGLYRIGMTNGMQMTGTAAPSGGTKAPTPVSAATRKPLYWHDPMVPQQKFDHPGKSPFMDMQLVPVYAEDEASGTSDDIQMASPMDSNKGSPATAPVAADMRKPLYWHDPMVPQQKFDHPGKSPFMDMQLVPVYAESNTDGEGIKISSRVQQNLGIRTTTVTKGVLGSTLTAVGSVAYNERDVAVVQARGNGFVEQLYVRAPLDHVTRGQALTALFVPEWVAVQEEYLSAKRIAATSLTPGLEDLVAGARQRMRLAGMDDAQIALVERTNTVHARLTVTAPRSGVITDLGAREGMTVMSGASLFRINGVATVWVNAALHETDARYLVPGSTVEAQAAAFPGETFSGEVGALLPEVDLATRTIKARIELANPRERLKPGMFVTVNFAPPSMHEVLLVPTEAVIQTGTRAVVMAAEAGGRFTPVEVEVGNEANGQTEIRKGLKANQQVVVSGQFLIDSEASLKGTVARMSTTEEMSKSATSPSSASMSAPAMKGDMSDEGMNIPKETTR